MRINLIPALAAPIFFAACSADPIIGSDTNLAQAQVNADEFMMETQARLDEMSETAFASLPAGESASYYGIVHGERGSFGGGPDIAHYADVSVSVNFETTDVNGSIFNVTTDMPGFEKPTGSVTISGYFEDDEGDVYFYADGSGSLTGTEMTADYELLSFDGYFYGENGEIIQGSSTVDFNWTSGAHNGTTSWSDGEFYLIAPLQP